MLTSRVSANGSTSVVSQHVFTSEIPTPGSESVRMAFCVHADPNRKLVGIRDDSEVVVDRFEFVP
jgi:hypothetical protein